MSYQISVYFTDVNSEYISSTNIRSGSFINVTKYHGDEPYIAGGFTNQTTFTATPADGCEFYRWAYRIGDGDRQYSTDNPFYYSGTEDIIIRAEGQPISGGGSGGDEITWEQTSHTLGSVDEFASKSAEDLKFDSYTIKRYSVQFAVAGIASVLLYGSSNYDVACYVTEGTSWDDIGGEPESPIDYGDSLFSEINLNFNVETNRTYYIWVRELSGLSVSTDILLSVSIIPLSTPSIDHWTWKKTNGKATDQQTQDAYTAIKNNGFTRNFSYLVWNDMVDKVNDIIKAFGRVWDYGDYGTYSETKMKGPNEILTSRKFNALRNNIEIIGLYEAELGATTGIGKVEKDYIVYGHYFTTLTQYMIDCIVYLE